MVLTKSHELQINRAGPRSASLSSQQGQMGQKSLPLSLFSALFLSFSTFKILCLSSPSNSTWAQSPLGNPEETEPLAAYRVLLCPKLRECGRPPGQEGTGKVFPAQERTRQSPLPCPTPGPSCCTLAVLHPVLTLFFF